MHAVRNFRVRRSSRRSSRNICSAASRLPSRRSTWKKELGRMAQGVWHVQRTSSLMVSCASCMVRATVPLMLLCRRSTRDVADFKVLSYTAHALEQGAEAQAIAYIQIQTPSGAAYFGAAIDTNIELAAVKAVLSALNRSERSRG